jgi:hypothetical protein
MNGCFGYLIMILAWAIYLILVYTFLDISYLTEIEKAIALAGLSIVCLISGRVLKGMNYSIWFYICSVITFVAAIVFFLIWIFS